MKKKGGFGRACRTSLKPNSYSYDPFHYCAPQHPMSAFSPHYGFGMSLLDSPYLILKSPSPSPRHCLSEYALRLSFINGSLCVAKPHREQRMKEDLFINK